MLFFDLVTLWVVLSGLVAHCVVFIILLVLLDLVELCEVSSDLDAACIILFDLLLLWVVCVGIVPIRVEIFEWSSSDCIIFLRRFGVSSTLELLRESVAKSFDADLSIFFATNASWSINQNNTLVLFKQFTESLIAPMITDLETMESLYALISV